MWCVKPFILAEIVLVLLIAALGVGQSDITIVVINLEETALLYVNDGQGYFARRVDSIGCTRLLEIAEKRLIIMV